MVRISLINGDEIVRRGVVSMLRQYQHQIELVDLSGPMTEPVDIALFDTFATDPGTGTNLARLIADPRFRRVVVYTWNFQPWMAREVIQEGVTGYLSQSLTAAQLIAALHQVHAGETVVAPAMKRNKIAGSDWPGREEGLTAREAEVLSLITMGLSNAEIAKRTALSLNSIKAYIRSCYRKIDVDSRSKAVLWGVAHGMRTSQLLPEAVDVAPPPDANRGRPASVLEASA